MKSLKPVRIFLAVALLLVASVFGWHWFGGVPLRDDALMLVSEAALRPAAVPLKHEASSSQAPPKLAASATADAPLKPASREKVQPSQCDIEQARLAGNDGRDEGRRILEKYGDQVNDLLAQLSAGTPEQALAALMLKRAFETERERSAANVSRCEDGDAACAQKAGAIESRQAAATMTAMMALSRRTGHLGVFAHVARACTQVTAQALHVDCSEFSLRQWAARDAGNATPWMYIASEASQRKDPVLVAEAMHQIAQASVFNPHIYTVFQALTHPALDPAHGVASAQAVFYLLDAQVRLEMLPQVAILRYCLDASPFDSNRRQLCQAVAKALGEKGSTLVDLGVAVNLGAKVGLSSSKLQLWADERDAAHALGARRMARLLAEDPGLCGTSARLKSMLLERARYTERGAIQRDAAALGVSLAALAQEVRADRQRIQAERAAEAAASAASR